MRVAGLILAAGLSERMRGGTPKQLLPLGGTTMLGRVVAAAEKTSLDPIVVVTGHRAAEVERAVRPGRARFTRNPDYRSGNVTSLRRGLSEIGDADAVVLLLADNPEVDAAVVEAMISAWGKGRPLAAVASYRGTIGHPFVLSRGATGEAGVLSGSKPLWHWLREEHAADVLEVAIDRDPPRDVNTMADYEDLLADLTPPGP